VDLDLSGRRRDDPVPGYALRLRPLQTVCIALVASVFLLAVLSWVLVRQTGGVSAPPALPLSLTFFAALLILLSSRVRSVLLRRGFPRSPALPIDPEAVLDAYRRATLVSFAILDAAASVGVLVAFTSGSPAYGAMLCLAGVFGMLTRWPRAGEVDRLVRGRLR
jgi:hypothetical protein